LLARNVYPIESIHRSDNPQTKDVEHLAEAFAAALLMPRDVVRQDVLDHCKDGRIEAVDLIRIAIEYGISTQALLFRLANIGILEYDDAKELLESPTLKSDNSNERLGANKAARGYSQRFVGLGMKALSDGRISKRRFCGIFEIPISKFSAFIEEYDFKDEPDGDVTYELHCS
jgi:Zn-dependent peptidase ImmA (M78 family)